jgi:hypothetical protein
MMQGMGNGVDNIRDWRKRVDEIARKRQVAVLLQLGDRLARLLPVDRHGCGPGTEGQMRR